ncbi:ABC transporter ATP-binding protein [Halieaceae bacterium IMCC14734]|uniref:ABC transporter ATP-binding protein n=1 Tax=Candidatus Litorirhabdus singularis TaxID=2518993 RepID=A0ABT3TEP8_9GAMM|nr:ABC transporter ATP-binding protein [Candidatus Litorirhabdus singularis]MCX2980788.1 ABC transporter ATP-binding protein [Candidatus Litorirhabdus singularis]
MQFFPLLKFVTPGRKALLLCAALLLAGSLLSLANPLIAGQLARTILATAGDPVYPLALIIPGWAGLLLLGALLRFGNGYYIGSVGESMATRLRSRVYEHMQALPLAYHQARRRGDVLTLMTNDADYISSFVTDSLLPLLPLGLTLGGAFTMMVWLDPLIALMVIIFMPLYFLALKIIGRQIRPLSRAWIDQYSTLIARVEENLAMLPALKSFRREAHEAEMFENDNQDLLSIWRRQLWVQSILSPAIDLLAGLGMLALLWLGSRHIEQGLLEPAAMVSLILYAGMLSAPLRSLADLYGQLQRTLGSAERLVEFFETAPEPSDAGRTSLPAVHGEIRFTRVDFAYSSRRPLLSKLDLCIAAGETVAITGRNGEGKSTIAHLLMRFADPDGGNITVDGHDIASTTLASLRQQIGLVAQHVLLLNASVADNIAYARPGASRKDIEAAASAAHARAFIEALPDQYDSVIGDEGIKLSGGQRQRLSLARTLLKDPPILILDEATAMFDPDGEADFIAECHDLLQQRTVILITHRPASLALADRVLVLEDGKLRESRR